MRATDQWKTAINSTQQPLLGWYPSNRPRGGAFSFRFRLSRFKVKSPMAADILTRIAKLHPRSRARSRLAARCDSRAGVGCRYPLRVALTSPSEDSTSIKWHGETNTDFAASADRTIGPTGSHLNRSEFTPHQEQIHGSSCPPDRRPNALRIRGLPKSRSGGIRYRTRDILLLNISASGVWRG
jgi:hypothetical protein